MSGFDKSRSFVCLISPMASKDKNTPQKLYKKQKESTVSSRCRLCNRITDPGHSKNIFRLQNQAILRNAEIVYGSNLPQDSNLPHCAAMICAPCERGLKNVVEFKKVIIETQRELQDNLRTKRCVEISPSISRPSAKVRAAGTSRRKYVRLGQVDAASILVLRLSNLKRIKGKH